MCVEEIGDEGKVEFGVAGYERCGREEFTAVKPISVLKHFFCSL